MTSEERTIRRMNILLKIDVFKRIEEELNNSLNGDVKNFMVNEKVRIETDDSFIFIFHLNGKFSINYSLKVLNSTNILPSYLRNIVFKVYLKHKGETKFYKEQYDIFLKSYRAEKINTLL